MTKIKVKEFAGLGEVTGKTKWRARIIGPGQGSSAYYPEDVLRTFGPGAFPAGTKMNIDHQTEFEEYDQPAGSLRWLAGALITDAEWSDQPEPGLYATVEFEPKWAEFVERFHEIIGLSISATATVDTDQDGTEVVTALIPSPLNTVDLVTVPGANGRFVEALEQWCDTMTDVNENSQEETSMDEAKVKEMLDGVAAQIIEALTPSEPEPVAKGASVTDVFSKVTSSGLTATNQTAIMRAFEADATADIDALIEEKKELEAEISAGLKPADDVKESFGQFDGRKEAPDYAARLAARIKKER